MIHTPLKEAFDPEQLAGLRTVPVGVEEWNGFVWISILTLRVPSFGGWLGEFADQIELVPLRGWTADHFGSWDLDSNWKTALDAFNETWHVPFTHRNTVRAACSGVTLRSSSTHLTQ